MHVKHENSYGIIPLKKIKGDWYVLLIKHKKGDYWAFPKGHANANETTVQTAERELFEETGLTVVKYFTNHPFHEDYEFQRGLQHIHKDVDYFLAEVEGTVRIQTEEILDVQWVKLDEALQYISFKESKRVFQLALDWLSESKIFNHRKQ